MAETDEIERRKFSLPSDLNERLVNLAEDHYLNNKSQFLRRAIRDHARTLENKDEFAIKQLQAEVESIGDEIEEIRELVEEKSVRNSSKLTKDDKTEESTKFGGAAVQRSVQKCLIKTDEAPLTLNELIANVDADPMEVQAAVEELLEKEFLKRVSDAEQTAYQIQHP